MKLTLEVSDTMYKRIRVAAGQKGSVSAGAFVRGAVENELRRVECDGVPPSDYGDLAALARQVQRLEKGQRAIVALVDSSAMVLAALLRGRGVRD